MLPKTSPARSEQQDAKTYQDNARTAEAKLRGQRHGKTMVNSSTNILQHLEHGTDWSDVARDLARVYLNSEAKRIC